MTIFIGSNNIHRFGKIQNAAAYGERDEVALLWDELTKKQKGIAENIDIDLKVHTSDPSSVPEKWNDDIVQDAEPGLDTTDIVKFTIANPSRIGVYEMLLEEEPPEPLLLWWIENSFHDADYSMMLSDVCHHGLFRTDKKFIYATVAFGVDAGVGSFSWPESGKEPKEVEQVKERLCEEHGWRRKELDEAWDEVKSLVPDWTHLDDAEVDALGVERSDDQTADSTDGDVGDGEGQRASSLLDF